MKKKSDLREVEFNLSLISISDVTNSPSSPGNIVGGAAPSNADAEEKYEKTAPVHGDVMFHNYLERVQENPGQIIR